MTIYTVRVLVKGYEHYADYGLYLKKENALKNLKKFQESKHVEDAFIAEYKTDD